MFARVTRMLIPRWELDADIDFRVSDAQTIATTAGGIGFHHLVNRHTGESLIMTLWDTEDAMLASEAMAADRRDARSAPAGAAVVSVERYQVVSSPSGPPARRRAYARVTRARIPPHEPRREKAVILEARRTVEAVLGSVGFYYLMNREQSDAMAIAFWDSEEAMASSEEMAAQRLWGRTSRVGAIPVGVETYEVVWPPSDRTTNDM